MDTQAYPGKDLSLSQLFFALDGELKRTMGSSSYVAGDQLSIVAGESSTLTCSRSFTSDKVSQIHRDATVMLANVREWKNSFVHINRIPSKVLSQISIHLPSRKDCFQATFVCRHWRKTLLQYTKLWTELDLRKGETYVKTLLERAGGSPLDIVSSFPPPVGAISALPPHTKQIRSLNFMQNNWVDIRKFSELNCGPLPLLRTLKISDTRGINPDNPDATIPLSLLLFSNAVSLQEFKLHSKGSPFLNHFVFPNLTSFELSVIQAGGFRASRLLDFLEASPMLQVVNVKIIGNILFDDVPRERAVVLPSVESLSLVLSYGEPGYDLVTYISCPIVKQTSLTHQKGVNHLILYKIFPSPASWDAIVRRCTRSPVEQVRLEMDTGTIGYTILKCSITFRSPDETVIKLFFEVTTKDWNWYEKEDNFEMPLPEMYGGVLSQACRIIRDLPQPTNVKLLRVSHNSCISDYTWVKSVVNKDSPNTMAPPSLLLSSNAVDPQRLHLCSKGLPFLNYFVVPNLTSFELSVERVEGFRASQLLNFLEASPMLRKVEMKIVGDILFGDVPRERAVVLPSVKSFSLAVTHGEPGYNLVTHISCPIVKHTSLTHKKDVSDLTFYNIFPSPWNTIVRQYKRSPVEQVKFQINMTRNTILACFLTFSSPDAADISLNFEVTKKDGNKNGDDFETPLQEIYCAVFSEACRIIRDLPRPANIKHLSIQHSPLVSEYTRVTPIANELGRLFESLGPLKRLELYRCDMRPYLVPSLTFPQIGHFKISCPLCPPHDDAEAAVVELAESQHALGVPFESVFIDMGKRSAEVVKSLRLWVGKACCPKRSG